MMNIDQVVESARASHKETPFITVTVAAPAEVDVSGVVKVFKTWQEENNTARKLIIGGSLGVYGIEPIVIIRKSHFYSILYGNVTEETASELVRDSLEGDDPRPDLAYCNLGHEEIKSVPFFSAIPLFKIQQRVALRNCGLVDGRDIDSYIAERQGYTGLARALTMDRHEALQEIAGLYSAAPGGTSFGDRWKIVQNAPGTEKYLVSRFFDVDVQDRTARLLLWGDPHSVLEGSLITAHVLGASHCIVLVSADENGAIERIREAVGQMPTRNLLGHKILGSEFNCDIEVRQATPSLVLEDDTALLALLEGGQAMPSERQKHSVQTFRDKPVLIERAETLSRFAAVFQKRAGWFREADAVSNIASKVITISGAAQHRCTVEVPTEMTLREVLFGAGVVSASAPFKAVRFGGPTGVLLSPDDLEVTLSGLSRQGLSIDVIPDDTCIVEYTADAVSEVQKQSCGQCVFCREGTIQISEILRDIVKGESGDGDLEIVSELSEAMRIFSSCCVGKNAAEMILSSLRLFHKEYELHIQGRTCGKQSPLKGSDEP